MKFNESHLYMDSTQMKSIKLILSILPGKYWSLLYNRTVINALILIFFVLQTFLKEWLESYFSKVAEEKVSDFSSYEWSPK